ncbi:hypothetical protein CGRA01v4_11018 [Colletotrichum graminicola]|nr:hypothetical protein CGRA01v4_11018 [Colletotrichum graminicola]
MNPDLGRQGSHPIIPNPNLAYLVLAHLFRFQFQAQGCERLSV